MLETPLNPKLYPPSTFETIELVPYGCARLRIGEFPVKKNKVYGCNWFE
jgi:uncharacterized protein